MQNGYSSISKIIGHGRELRTPLLRSLVLCCCNNFLLYSVLRMKLLRQVSKTWKTDGLNSCSYRLLAVEHNPLYINITVDFSAQTKTSKGWAPHRFEEMAMDTVCGWWYSRWLAALCSKEYLSSTEECFSAWHLIDQQRSSFSEDWRHETDPQAGPGVLLCTFCWDVCKLLCLGWSSRRY